MSGDEVTPAELSNMVNNATISGIVNADIASAADIAGSKLANGGVTSDKLATGAVTGADGGGKLAASVITGQTAIDAIADADTFLVHDASSSALRKVAYSGIKPTTLTFGTAQNSTSGTSLTFTGIPSTAKRITVIFNGVSTVQAGGGTGATSLWLIRLGTASGVVSTGYISHGGYAGGSQGDVTSTSGFVVAGTNRDDTKYAHMVITNLNANTWVSSHFGGYAGSNASFLVAGGGNVSLSGACDRVVITTTNGTDTFDAGSVNICYE